jgi:hypothetical protein
MRLRSRRDLETRTIRQAVLLTESEAHRLAQRAEELGVTRAELLRESGVPRESETPMVDVTLPADLARDLLRALERTGER